MKLRKLQTVLGYVGKRGWRGISAAGRDDDDCFYYYKK